MIASTNVIVRCVMIAFANVIVKRSRTWSFLKPLFVLISQHSSIVWLSKLNEKKAYLEVNRLGKIDFWSVVDKLSLRDLQKLFWRTAIANVITDSFIYVILGFYFNNSWFEQRFDYIWLVKLFYEKLLFQEMLSSKYCMAWNEIAKETECG